MFNYFLQRFLFLKLVGRLKNGPLPRRVSKLKHKQPRQLRGRGPGARGLERRREPVRDLDPAGLRRDLQRYLKRSAISKKKEATLGKLLSRSQ